MRIANWEPLKAQVPFHVLPFAYYMRPAVWNNGKTQKDCDFWQWISLATKLKEAAQTGAPAQSG